MAPRARILTRGLAGDLLSLPYPLTRGLVLVPAAGAETWILPSFAKVARVTGHMKKGDLKDAMPPWPQGRDLILPRAT